MLGGTLKSLSALGTLKAVPGAQFNSQALRRLRMYQRRGATVSERIIASRYLLSEQTAKDSRSHKGQHDERGQVTVYQHGVYA